MESIKFKIVIFIILIISLIVTLFYGIFGFSLSYLSEDEIKIERPEIMTATEFLKKY